MISELGKISARAQLIKVRATLEKGWTRGVLAKDLAGNVVAPDSQAAVAWCILGAFYCNNFASNCDGWKALEEIDPTPVTANDEKFLKQTDALAFIDQAIALVST